MTLAIALRAIALQAVALRFLVLRFISIYHGISLLRYIALLAKRIVGLCGVRARDRKRIKFICVCELSHSSTMYPSRVRSNPWLWQKASGPQGHTMTGPRDRAFQQQLSVLNQQARSEYREAWHSAVEKGAGSGLGPRCVNHEVPDWPWP